MLGGSLARGAPSPDSDIDLGLHYRPARAPDIEALRALGRELQGEGEPTVTALGEWGRWVNGGAWLVVEGHRLDWLYRDLDLTERTIAECLDGRVRVDYQVGHPHGWPNHRYLGELHHGVVLEDPDGTLAGLKDLVAVYPAPMRRAIVRRSLAEASFSLGLARTGAGRGDVAYVAGNLYRCVASFVETILALNERYSLNEKGSVAQAAKLPICPDGFADTVAALLGAPGRTRDELYRSVTAAAALNEMMETIAVQSSPDARPPRGG
jgi:hypothetical protein